MAAGNEPARRQCLCTLNEPGVRDCLRWRGCERVADEFTGQLGVAKRIIAFESDQRQLALAGLRRSCQFILREIHTVGE